MRVESDGRRLITGDERHEFASAEEAHGRASFIAEALTWVGTPFLDVAGVKGPNGAVDCARLILECGITAGLVPDVPRPKYPPRWFLRESEPERFIEFIAGTLGRREVAAPQIGDVHVYFIARKFAHGGIRINSREIVHAYYQAQMCMISPVDDPVLTSIPIRGHSIPRPVRYFDSWSR